MAAPARSAPGAMPADEALVRLRCPHARAVAVHAADDSPPICHVVEHPTRSIVALGTGPDEAAAWKDAADRMRAWITFVS